MPFLSRAHSTLQLSTTDTKYASATELIALYSYLSLMQKTQAPQTHRVIHKEPASHTHMHAHTYAVTCHVLSVNLKEEYILFLQFAPVNFVTNVLSCSSFAIFLCHSVWCWINACKLLLLETYIVCSWRNLVVWSFWCLKMCYCC